MLLILISTVIFIWLFNELYWKRRNLPPGPMPIPFVGNMISVARPFPGYECFRRWTKEYNGVYTFWLGSEPYVIISSYDRIKETFVRDGDTYVDKKQFKFQEQSRGGSFGVIETNGLVWSTHRRFALTSLRDLGLGKDVMQQRILIEVEDVFTKFDANLSKDQNIEKVITKAIANVINQVVFGYRFEDDEEFQKLQSILSSQEKTFSSFLVLLKLFIPLLGNILPGRSVEEIISVFKNDFNAFFNKQIEEHRKKIDFESEESEDYAEAYLKEQRKREADGDFETFSDKQLTNMCLDLWFAGLATTNTTITWAIAYVLHNPRVQEKVHEEMDRVIGSDRLITTADKNRLVYTSAVINESQRCANIIPLNLTHQTTRDTEIGGFAVKKGTGVVAQISTVMLDETVFAEADKFEPDRFVDEHGNARKIEQFVPFSMGKRQCLGEGLARMELFLFLANILNRYKISPSASGGLPSIDKTKEMGVTPRKFDAVLERRHK